MVPEDGEVGPLVVVLDNSLSMDHREGDTLLSVARDEAVELRGCPRARGWGRPRAARRPAGPRLVDDPGLVAAALAEVSQSQGATDLAGALAQARRMLGCGRTVVFLDESGESAVPA